MTRLLRMRTARLLNIGVEGIILLLRVSVRLRDTDTIRLLKSDARLLREGIVSFSKRMRVELKQFLFISMITIRKRKPLIRFKISCLIKFLL